mmetsp:Transcript_3204/g.4878  ORF Transcript_3204/g.4878 Transcript_3204/m.4878 type:complete len:223 (-) Transcript_3204:71-739(-)
MTSNMGATTIAELPSHLTGIEPHVQESIMEVIRNTLPPELLNRITEVVPFARLQPEHMESIARMGLQKIRERLVSEHGIGLDVSPAALDVISARGYNIRYGARPLQRVLNKEVLHPLSRMILEEGGGVVPIIREVDDEIIRVRTRAEAERNNNNNNNNENENNNNHFGFLSSTKEQDAVDKNDIVILRNHPISKDNNNNNEIMSDDETTKKTSEEGDDLLEA